MKKRSISSALSISFLLVIIFLIYSNVFNAPWVLDDPPNISNNAPLRIDNLMPETLWQTLHAKPFAPGVLYRPVANLSFALNWYVGRDNPFGYHIVNILIHILTALILFYTISLLFQTPALIKYSRSDAYFIALLAAALWAINPIQTQAVTYIVQRMASLATMFYIWAIFWYLKFRLTKISDRRLLPILLCTLCYLFSIGSKENGAILPISLLALEFIFFPKPQEIFFTNTRRILLAMASGIVVLAIYYIIQHNYLANPFKPIGSRPFSLYERLITEPSIILFYLSLIFYPLPQRLSVDHGVTIAHSIFNPWTTLPSILIIFALLFIALRTRKKWPLLSFALFFFFINHLIESTIIPLELIFEHRNYLPSMFLFVPVAAGILYLLKIYSNRNKVVYSAVLLFIPLLLTGMGWSTYLRNDVWASEKMLWQDALQKAPNNSRPLAKLGELAGWNPAKSPEQLSLAIGYYQKALISYSPRTSFKAAILGNMGEIFLMYGLYDQAIKYYNKSLELNSHFNNSEYGLVKALVMKGEFDQAITEVASALDANHSQSRFLNIGGLIFLWQGKADAALWSFQQAMRISRYKQPYFYNLGVALSKAGYYDRAEWFLKAAHRSQPQDIKILFSLLENSVRAEDKEQVDNIFEKIFRQFSIPMITENLKILQKDYRNVPISIDLISPVIDKKIKQHIAILMIKYKKEVHTLE